jgi:hypothetical protein
MNAALTSGVFVFAAHARNFFENFSGSRRDEKLGCEIGQIHAIRVYRMTPRRGRKMLRRVIDRRCVASRAEIESSSMSITTHDEQVESREDVGRALFALTAESV